MANGRIPNQPDYLRSLDGRPPMQQIPQTPLGGGGGGNPMAAILMGLGGGLSSRAAGGTLGQGFTRGARLGMSMAQAKQLRGRQKEILRRQDEADRREERRLKLLEEKRTEEKTAFKNIQAFRKSALAGGGLPPSLITGLEGKEPRKAYGKYQAGREKAQASQAKVYSTALQDKIGLNPVKATVAAKYMAKNPKFADSVYGFLEAGGGGGSGDLPPEFLARLGRGETFAFIDSDGEIKMNPAPEKFKKGTESTSLAINPAKYLKLFPNSGVR